MIKICLDWLRGAASNYRLCGKALFLASLKETGPCSNSSCLIFES